MAKSLRSKKKKRLRTIRREIAQPFYDTKEAAKLAAQEAALNAPKLPVPSFYNKTNDSDAATAPNNSTDMDVEMGEDRTNAPGSSLSSLKPVGGVGKKWKGKSKRKKDKRCRKGKIMRKKI